MRRLLGAFIAVLAFGTTPLSSAPGGAAESAPVPLSLEECVRLAVARGPLLLAARERASEAGGRASEMRTAFFPQIAGSAAYTRLDVAPYLPAAIIGQMTGGSLPPGALPDKIEIGRRDNYSASLRIEQPLFAGGRIRNGYDGARFAADAAEAELEGASHDVVFEATRAYLACVQAEERTRLAETALRRIEAQLADVEGMRVAGLAARNDVLKTKVYHAESRIALLRARNAARLAGDRLCSLIDLPFGTGLLLLSRADTVSPDTIDLDAAVRAALSGRPELREIECRRRIAEGEIRVHRNGYLPDLSLFADLSWRNPDREYEPEFYSTWSIGVAARMNVFDWGRAVHRTRQARSRLEQIGHARTALEDAVELEVTRAHLACGEAWSEIDVSREAIEAARENFRVTNERLKEGLSTNTELLDAQTLLAQAETALAGAKIDYLVARADRARAMGTIAR